MAYRVPNGTAQGNDRAIVQSPGSIGATSWGAPNGRVFRHGPRRPAQYQQNWSGHADWQTWSDLRFPPDQRQVIEAQNAQAAAQVMLQRNIDLRHAPRPVPIADYTLQTRQTYIGTIDASGRIYNG